MTDTVTVTNPYLTGNYAPVTEETTAVAAGETVEVMALDRDY